MKEQAENIPPKRPRGLFLFYVSKRFTFQFNVFLDKYTLDFPRVKIGGGMQAVEWLQDNTDAWGQVVSQSNYDCYGLSFEIFIWFIEVKVVFTPITIKKKS